MAAELAAALRISRALASRYMSDAEVMRERLPKVGETFRGDINYAMFNVIATRTAPIADDNALAAVGEQVALWAPRWPSLTRGRLAMRIDAIVLQVDRDAIRRTDKEVKDRYLNVSLSTSSIAEVYGNVFASTARALDHRLDELAGTVCAADPRTLAQRRADAMTALAAGTDRMACACGDPECVAMRGRMRDCNVVIHVVAEQPSVAGTASAPGFMAGVDELIPAQVIAELAKSANFAGVECALTASSAQRAEFSRFSRPRFTVEAVSAHSMHVAHA